MRPRGVGPSLGRVSRFFGGLQATLLILALCAASGAAQSIVVRVGDETTVSVAPGAEIEIPVVVDMAQAAGLDIASLTFELTWDPSLLSYVGAAPGTFGSVVFNEADVASGRLATSLFNATGTTNTFTAINIVLSASPAAENQDASVAVDVTAAGDGNGIDILAFVSEAKLCLCIGIGGLLGDVSDDGTVNIIDAQQIARYSVGLPPPPDPAIVDARSDVNEDGQRNIIDAQQIARWTVGLPVPESPRIGQAMPGGCPGVCDDGITPGPYSGTTSQGEAITFAVSADAGSIEAGLKIGFFACQFCTSTITMNISLPIAQRSFSYSSSGFSITGSAEPGTTFSGSATYTPSGAPPECGTCQTVNVTWTASWIGPLPAPGSAAIGTGDLAPKLGPSMGRVFYQTDCVDMVIEHRKQE